MTFICELCNYSTDLKANYDKHILTKKHTLKRSQKEHKSIEDQNIASSEVIVFRCYFCKKNFMNNKSFDNHKGKCNGINDLNQQISMLEDNIKQDRQEAYKQKMDLEDNIIRRRNEILQLKEELMVKKNELYALNENHKNILEKYNALSISNNELKNEIVQYKGQIDILCKLNQSKSGDVRITNNNVVATNALTFVTNNYNEAPAIHKFSSFKMLGDDQISIAESAIYYYIKKKSAKWIGDVIIQEYSKKNNPSQQTVWSSDTSRLAYLVREMINQSLTWSIDKNGIKTSEYIIKPILDHVGEAIRFYIQDLSKKINGDERNDMKIIRSQAEGGSLIQIIENGDLNRDTLKYIAPSFHLDRNISDLLKINDKKDEIILENESDDEN